MAMTLWQMVIPLPDVSSEQMRDQAESRRMNDSQSMMLYSTSTVLLAWEARPHSAAHLPFSRRDA